MFFVTVASGSLGLLFLRHRRTGAFQYITVNDAPDNRVFIRPWSSAIERFRKYTTR